MNGNNSRTIWRKRNKRRVKNPVGVRRQKAAGSRKSPTETPTDGTKIGAEVVKPLLKNRSVFKKPRSVLWTTGRWFENPEAVVLKHRMRKWNSKTPSRCLEKSPVGGFKMILK